MTRRSLFSSLAAFAVAPFVALENGVRKVVGKPPTYPMYWNNTFSYVTPNGQQVFISHCNVLAPGSGDTIPPTWIVTE